MSEMAASYLLRIGRFRIDCLVPRDHPSPEQARDRLADLVEKKVPSALSSVMARALSARDESLWFIRELHLAVDLNVSVDTHDVARSFAAQTARTLFGEMSAGDGKNIVRFDNHAQFLAAFLVDLAEGCAWQRWYYRRFEGLRVLPRSAALRTAICEDAETGLAALHYLAPPMAAKIVGCLAEADAQWILRVIGDSEATEAQDITEEFLVASLATLRRLPVGRHTAAASVLLLIEVKRSGAARESRAGWLCEGLVALARHLDKAPGSRGQLLEAIRRPDEKLLYQLTEHAEIEGITPLLRLPDSLRARIIEAFVARRESTSTGDDATQRFTRFGGAFFLLPLLDRLPFSADFFGAEDQTDDVLAQLRWLILIKCFGRERAPDAARDPVLREIAGVTPADSLQDLIERWQQRVRTRHLHRLIATLRRYRRVNHFISGSAPILVSVDAKVAVKLDISRGYWTSVLPVPRFPARELDKADLPQPVRDSLDRLVDDFNHFALPEEFGLASTHDCALSVISQGLIKDFAWRLPGFSWSGPGYLYENFLNCSARIEAEAERYVVTLGASPLSLILNVAGIHRQRFELSWLKGPRFELYPEHC